jgi:hypothetical protein
MGFGGKVSFELCGKNESRGQVARLLKHFFSSSLVEPDHQRH